MFRKVVLFLSFILLFLFAPSDVKADNEFYTDSVVTYHVQENGKTLVTHEITLENAFSTIYATSYAVALENIDVQNASAVNENGKEIKVATEENGDRTTIKLEFSDAVVGKGEKRHFYVSYENANFAVRTGEIWEIAVPKLSDNNTFRSYAVKLVVPQSFGLEAYISPKPVGTDQDQKNKTYTFSREDLSKTSLTAGFGQFQVFSFNLSYHLENPLAVGADTQVALPPDTAFQKVYFTKISPEPADVVIDPDGNWLATFHLSPRQRVDVNVLGSVQIFASNRKFPTPDESVLSANLHQTDYWQTDDPQIKALAAELKTPEAIYNYVVSTLKYNYDRVTPTVQRFGAKKALENPLSAICMEFTDLFVAISRAAGIPAREVNGFAYTENPQLQPLSLVADVLHAWPEYYDAKKGAWIPVDPTWGSTSGSDFFNKLDLRHFTFVIHGESSIKPYAPGSYKLGPNPQKDIFVSFGKLPDNRNVTPRLSVTPKSSIPFMDTVFSVTVSNPGPSALYGLSPAVYFDGKENSRGFVEVLTPFSKHKFDVKVPFSLLGKNTPNEVSVSVEGSTVKISTNKSQVIVNSLLMILLACGVILFAVLLKLRKITFDPLLAFFDNLFAKIRERYAKLVGKADQNSPSGSQGGKTPGGQKSS